MNNEITLLKMTVGAICSLMTYIFGGMDMLLTTLVLLVTLDYITGFLAGVANKTLSSEVGYKGLIKKVAIFIIVALSHISGQALGFELRAFVIGFYIMNEAISITENCGKIGVPMPKKLLDVLKQLNEDKENK